MKCTICKNGETKKGFTTVTLERNGSVIIFKDTAAQICTNCGEYYLDATVTEQLMKQAGDALQHGTEVEIIRLKKAS